jgi:hypothetical protein
VPSFGQRNLDVLRCTRWKACASILGARCTLEEAKLGFKIEYEGKCQACSPITDQ